MFGVAAVGLLLSGPVRTDADGVPLPAEAVCRIGSARWRAADSIEHLHCTPDGRTLVAVENSRVLVGWDAATGFPLYRVPLPAGDRAMRLTLPPGQPFARVEFVTSDEAFGSARHDPRTGHRVGAPIQHLKRLRETAYLSPGGRFVFEDFRDTVRRYSVDETDYVLTVRPADGSGPPVELLRERRQFTVAVSPDERHVAVGRFDPDSDRPLAWLLDATTGKQVRPLGFTGDRVSSLAFSPDGASVGGWYGTGEGEQAVRTLAVWEVATGRRRDVVTERLPADQTRVWFAPDGRHVVTNDSGKVYDSHTGRVAFRPQEYVLTPVAFGPAVSSAYAYGSAWGVRPLGPVAHPLPWGSGDELAPLAFTDDGRLVIRAETYWANRYLGCDPRTGRLVDRGYPLERSHRLSLSAVTREGRLVFQPPGVFAEVDGPPNRIEVRDTRTGEQRATLVGHSSEPLEARLTRDGRRLVTTAKGEFRVWDAATFTRVDAGRIEEYDGHRVLSDFPPQQAMAVSADGRWLAHGVRGRLSDRKGAEGDELGVWDLAKPGPPVRRFPASGATHHTAAITHDGRLVAAAGLRPQPNGPVVKFGSWEGSVVRAWEVHTERCMLEHRFPTGLLSNPEFSPDGRTLAVGTTGSLVLIEVASGAVRHTFVGHVGHVEHVRFAPDGRRLAAASPDAPVFVWDVRGELSKPTAVSPEQLDAAVRDLASPDAVAAFRAVRLLAHVPAQAVPKLRAALPPVPPLPAGKVAGLVRQLDAPRFADRQAAGRELAALGRAAEAELREAANSPSAEVRRRADELLAKLKAGQPTADDLRAVRAVEVVEWMSVDEACGLLREWAAGVRHARLTVESKAAVGRQTAAPPGGR